MIKKIIVISLIFATICWATLTWGMMDNENRRFFERGLDNARVSVTGYSNRYNWKNWDPNKFGSLVQSAVEWRRIEVMKQNNKLLAERNKLLKEQVEEEKKQTTALEQLARKRPVQVTRCCAIL